MHWTIFGLCITQHAFSQSISSGNQYWTSQFFLKPEWAPYASQVKDEADVLKEINNDMQQGYQPSFVMCPAISPDTLPQQPSTPAAQQAWLQANATSAQTYHYDVSERFASVINPANFPSAQQANQHFRNVFGDVTNKKDFAGFFAFRPNFKTAAGVQARYRGPPFDFQNAFVDKDIVPLKQDDYWSAWAQYVAFGTTENNLDWTLFEQNAYVVRDPVLCWSLVLSARLKNSVTVPTAISTSDPSSYVPINLWTNKCVGACTAKQLDSISPDKTTPISLSELKALCLTVIECKGIFYNSAEKKGVYVTNNPKFSDLSSLDGEYDLYLERYIEDVQGRAFARSGTYPVSEYVDKLITYQLQTFDNAVILPRPDDCFALNVPACYVNQSGWYTEKDPHTNYSRVYKRRGEHTPASCKARCHLDSECMAWTWKPNDCRITTGIGQLTSSIARANENVMRNLGLDPTKPCAQTNHAFDICSQQCVDIREPLQMGWCNSKWVNCVNSKDLPETAETQQVAALKEMWKKTGCTTNTFPLDTLGRYLTLQTKFSYAQIASEMNSWCTCATGTTSSATCLNFQDQIYTPTSGFAYEACQPDFKKQCVLLNEDIIADIIKTDYVSNAKNMRTCVGGFFEQKEVVRTQFDEGSNTQGAQPDFFRPNLAKTRRKKSNMLGAYESELCGNIGASVIHGDGELERWIQWSQNNVFTNEKYMPKSLRLASFSVKTFVTGKKATNPVDGTNIGTEYASTTAGIIEQLGNSNDCLGNKPCVHPTCRANRANVYAPMPPFTLQQFYDAIEKYELESETNALEVPCLTFTPECGKTRTNLCQNQFGMDWVAGGQFNIKLPSSRGSGWNQEQLCPFTSCFSKTNYMLNQNKQTGLVDCEALHLSGTRFIDSQQTQQKANLPIDNNALAYFNNVIDNTILPDSLARVFVDSPESFQPNYQTGWQPTDQDLHNIITPSALENSSPGLVSQGTIQTAQRKFADLNPKDANNKADATTYGKKDNKIFQTPLKTNLKFAELIATAPNLDHANTANFGLMCPIGIQEHNLAQLTMQCPASKPIRCSHATVVEPAGGTCAFSFNNNGKAKEFTGDSSQYAKWYQYSLPITDVPARNCNADDTACNKLHATFANLNGFDLNNNVIDVDYYYTACNVGKYRFPDVFYKHPDIQLTFKNNVAHLTPNDYKTASETGNCFNNFNPSKDKACYDKYEEPITSWNNIGLPNDRQKTQFMLSLFWDPKFHDYLPYVELASLNEINNCKGYYRNILQIESNNLFQGESFVENNLFFVTVQRDKLTSFSQGDVTAYQYPDLPLQTLYNAANVCRQSSDTDTFEFEGNTITWNTSKPLIDLTGATTSIVSTATINIPNDCPCPLGLNYDEIRSTFTCVHRQEHIYRNQDKTDKLKDFSYWFSQPKTDQEFFVEPNDQDTDGLAKPGRLKVPAGVNKYQWWNHKCSIVLSRLYDFLQRRLGTCFNTEKTDRTCMKWDDFSKPTIENRTKTETAQYVNKIMQHSPCHVYDMSCHSVEDSKNMNVCGQSSLGADGKDVQPLGGVKCGSKPYDGLENGFCGVDDKQNMLSAQKAYEHCSTWPTGLLRICEPGYALVWVDNTPVCQMALSAKKDTFFGVNNILPDMQIRNNVIQANTTLYLLSSKCLANEVATDEGKCVPQDCTARDAQNCAVDDIMHSPNNITQSCKLEGTICKSNINGVIETHGQLWWPGFVQDNQAFAGVGPAYMNQFDSCLDTKNSCQGFSLCGTPQVNFRDCLKKDIIENQCCNGYGVTDNGLQCIATPTTVCAGGQSVFYNDASAFSTTSQNANVCTAHGDIKASSDNSGSCACCVQNCKEKASAVINQAEYRIETGLNVAFEAQIRELFLTFVDTNTFESTDSQSCLGAEQRLSGLMYDGNQPSCACKTQSVKKQIDNFVIDNTLVQSVLVIKSSAHSIDECRQQCDALDPPCMFYSVDTTEVTDALDGTGVQSDVPPMYRCHIQPVMIMPTYTISKGQQNAMTFAGKALFGTLAKWTHPLIVVKEQQPSSNFLELLCLDDDLCFGYQDTNLLKYTHVENTRQYQISSPKYVIPNQNKIVFHVQSVQGTYKISSADKLNVCTKFNAKLCTYNDMDIAQKTANAEWCACSFVTDREYTFYPMQSVKQGCGSKIGVSLCSQTQFADVCCIKSSDTDTVTQLAKPFTTKNTFIRQYTCDPTVSCAYTQTDYHVHSFLHDLNDNNLLQVDDSYCKQKATLIMMQQWCISSGNHCIGVVQTPNALCLHMLDDAKQFTNNCLNNNNCGIVYKRYSALLSNHYWNYNVKPLGSLSHPHSVLFDANTATAKCASETTCNGVHWFRNGSVAFWYGNTTDAQLPIDTLLFASKQLPSMMCPVDFPYAYDFQGIAGSKCCKRLPFGSHFGPRVFEHCENKVEEFDKGIVPDDQPLYSFVVRKDHTSVQRCPLHQECVHGTSVLNAQSNKCICQCDQYFTGPLCDVCTRDNTEDDCFTCKPNFVKSENDLCVCRPGFDVKTGCTSCLSGYLPPDCNVDSCSYSFKPTISDNVNLLRDVVVAYNNDSLLYEGMYAAGNGRIPHSMQNSFVYQDGRLFWLHYNTRTEIVGYDMCSLYNRAVQKCQFGYELKDDGIYHCNTGVLVASKPQVCPHCTFKSEAEAAQAAGTVLAQCTIDSNNNAQLRVDTNLCSGACTVQGRSCTQNSVSFCCVNNQWSQGVCDQEGLRYEAITHHLSGPWLYTVPELPNVSTRVQLITNNITWGARCWTDQAKAKQYQISLYGTNQNYDDSSIIISQANTADGASCATICYNNLFCGAFVWDKGVCRIVSNKKQLRSSEYFVDPENCVSGGFFGTGKWRNLPNNVQLAVPHINQQLQKNPIWLQYHLVCAFGQNIVYMLSEYRKHIWPNILCSHAAVIHVHDAWLRSIPRGDSFDKTAAHHAWYGWKFSSGLVTNNNVNLCLSTCNNSVNCAHWMHDGTKCLQKFTSMTYESKAQNTTCIGTHIFEYSNVHFEHVCATKCDALPTCTEFSFHFVKKKCQISLAASGTCTTQLLPGSTLYQLPKTKIHVKQAGGYKFNTFVPASYTKQSTGCALKTTQSFAQSMRQKDCQQLCDLSPTICAAYTYDQTDSTTCRLHSTTFEEQENVKTCFVKENALDLFVHPFLQPTGSIAVAKAVETHKAYSSQQCCQKCNSKTWRFDGATCLCYDALLQGDDDCWVSKQASSKGCQARVTMSRRLAKLVTAGNIVFTENVETDTACAIKCAQDHSCRFALYDGASCTAYDKESTWQEGTDTYVLEKRGGCMLDAGNCVYASKESFVPGVTAPTTCSANNAHYAKSANLMFYYANSDKEVIQTEINDCSGENDKQPPLQPRAIVPFNGDRLQTVDSNLIIDRASRFITAWNASAVTFNPFDDGLGGLAYASRPLQFLKPTFDSLSFVNVEQNNIVVPANKDNYELRMFQITAPVPRSSSTRDECDEQASLATLSVGINKTPLQSQCFSIGSCVPAAHDAGAFDDVYNAYIEQLQTCMAADHAESLTPVPMAIVMQPGKLFQLQTYQDIPVYVRPQVPTGQDTPIGPRAQFGSRVSHFPTQSPSPGPFDPPTPAPIAPSPQPVTQFANCPFVAYENQTLQNADALVTQLQQTSSSTTKDQCGTMCALLLTCRFFVYNGVCQLYSINNVGSANCKNSNCNGLWVNDAEQDCSVVMNSQYRLAKSLSSVHVKQNCCFISA